MSRAETGPMRVGDDWCGVFIRGDNALMRYRPALMAAIDHMKKCDHAGWGTMFVGALEDLSRLMEECAEPMTPDDLVKVQTVQMVEK